MRAQSRTAQPIVQCKTEFSQLGTSGMTDRTAAGNEVLSALTDGKWHRLTEIAAPLEALAGGSLSRAIALGCIARLRDDGYAIEDHANCYRLVSVPDRRIPRA
jgi:biotin operon repressor